MNSTQSDDFFIFQVAATTDLSPDEWNDAAASYARAFAEPPYREIFTIEAARAALQKLVARGGNLVVGRCDGRVVSLAGGYPLASGAYYIDELAVVPITQGRGWGRQTLRALLEVAATRRPTGYEVRTTAANGRALRLYASEGFVVDSVREVVPALRTDGRSRVDERLYLTRPPRAPAAVRAEGLRRVIVASPSGNTTAIIFDQLLDVDRETLNRNVMNEWKRQNPGAPEVEQCCFITLPTQAGTIARVEMLGGEFCANATRAAVAVLLQGRDGEGLIEVSGAPRPLRFWMRGGLSGVEIPVPDRSDAIAATAWGTLVRLDGIAQVVVTDPTIRTSTSARQVLREVLRRGGGGLDREPAVGVSFYDETTQAATFAVYVRDVDTVFDETACGSGTAAIGIAIANRRGGDQALGVLQPSGERISVAVSYDAVGRRSTRAVISGAVDIAYDGPLNVRIPRAAAAPQREQLG